MCNVFSGLIVTKKGKDWGKALFLSGVHHEKDREKVAKKYGDEVIAWESVNSYSLDSFKFTHTFKISEKEQKELLKLVNSWAKKQDKEKLLRSMITVTKDNKKTEDYKVLDNMIKLGDDMSLVCDFSANIEAGNGSTQTAGDGSTQTAGYGSTQTAGYWSTQKAGYGSTQKAGGWSTCIIYGEESYVVLDGKNVVLRQIYGDKSYILEINKLFKKYKKGDKIRIVKGKDKGKINKRGE